MRRICFDRSRLDRAVHPNANPGAGVYDGKFAGRTARKILIGGPARDFGKRLVTRRPCVFCRRGDVEPASLQNRTFVQREGDTIVQA